MNELPPGNVLPAKNPISLFSMQGYACHSTTKLVLRQGKYIIFFSSTIPTKQGQRKQDFLQYVLLLINRSLSTSKQSCQKVKNIFLKCMRCKSCPEKERVSGRRLHPPSCHFSFSQPPSFVVINLHDFWPHE